MVKESFWAYQFQALVFIKFSQKTETQTNNYITGTVHAAQAEAGAKAVPLLG